MMMAAVSAAVFFGCERREVMAGNDGFDGDDIVTDAGDTGYIVVSGDCLTVEFDAERVGTTEPGAPSTRADEGPDTGRFWVEIIDASTQQTVMRSRLAEIGGEPIEVKLGSYYVRAYSGDSYEVAGSAFWAGDADCSQPSWAGDGKPFVITRDDTKEHPHDAGAIVCTMQTVKVTVMLEKALAARFRADKTDITVAVTGDEEYTAGSGNSVVFRNDVHRYGLAELSEDKLSAGFIERESDICYMVAGESQTAMFVNIKTEFLEVNEDDGVSVWRDLDMTIPVAREGVGAGQWRKITLFLDAAAAEQTGRIVIGATIETWVYDEEVPVYADEQTAMLGEQVIMDMDPRFLRLYSDDFDLSGSRVRELAYTADGVLIGSARVGLYNDTGSAAESFMVRISTQNEAFASILTTLGMNGVWTEIMDSGAAVDDARSQLHEWGFPRKSAVEAAGSKGFAFELNGLLGRLYDYPGRHDVSLAVVSGEYCSRAELALNVAGGDAAVPAAAPTIEWVGYDIDSRYTVKEGLQVKVEVSAPAGIRDFMVEIKGALRGDLPSVGLVEEFNLVDPDASKEGLSGSLEELGFPTGDNVRNKTAVGFDISDFMLLLGTFRGENDFCLTVTDNNGRTTSKTVMLLVE